jgi:quercetin dioxygenase-like cupin family protein
MSAFEELAAIAPRAIWDGVIARTVEGEQLSVAVVELDPGSVVSEHSHENEQLGIVLRGSVTFRVGEEERLLEPGGTWRIPPNAPHEVHAGPDGAVVIDVFAPRREDWAALEQLEPQRPRWPGNEPEPR